MTTHLTWIQFIESYIDEHGHEMDSYEETRELVGKAFRSLSSTGVHETVKAFDMYFHDGEPVNITFRDFYQMLYELKDFGPTIGFLFKEDDGWIYNDDLPEKTLDELPVLGISISSIIEGSDNEIAPVEFKGDFEPQEFWNAMDEISIEVDRIWNEYNGENQNEEAIR